MHFDQLKRRDFITLIGVGGNMAIRSAGAAGSTDAAHWDLDIPSKRSRMAIPRWRITTRVAKTGMDAGQQH